MISYAQSLIDRMLSQGKDFDPDFLYKASAKTEEDLKMQSVLPQRLTSLQQAKLIARFLHLKRRPTENRQFYEYFFDQQEKANSID